ncbi:MAG: substrate-binding domain-containing protein [Firmicutes bacterium]|nr:substrate-binding domain-containing protein [Bacillota bacterium]
MKKVLKKVIVLALALSVALGVMVFMTGCSPDVVDMQIVAISRESGSGTRGQWDGAIHNGLDGDARQTLANWMGAGTTARPLAGSIQNGQSNVVFTVAGQRNAIGYASFSAIQGNANLRVLNINGHAPGTTNYPAALARDYVILTYSGVTLLPLTQLFLDFMQSSEGQEVIETAGYDFHGDNAEPFNIPSVRPTGQDEPIQIRGSTSVEPVMGELIDAFVALVPWIVLADFDFEAGGSGQGVTAGSGGTIGGSVPNRTIGMSSNAAHITTANSNTFFLANDVMAAFVNADNPLTNITIEQLFGIYTGAITAWADLIN